VRVGDRRANDRGVWHQRRALRSADESRLPLGQAQRRAREDKRGATRLADQSPLRPGRARRRRICHLTMQRSVCSQDAW
jgi:hypothetical protein